MKKWLKYLLSIIIAIVFFNGFELVESTISDDYTIDLSTKKIANIDDCSTCDFEAIFPNQPSSTNALRLQNTSKRNNCFHNNQIKAIKANRIDIFGKRNNTQHKNLIIHHSFTRPFHRLISLGKLVI